MTTVALSPIWNGIQFFDNLGKPLSGGLVFTYEGGSNSVEATTYTTTDGDVENSNPIVLDSSGRMITDLWLIAGDAYNLVLTKPDGSTVLTDVDNVVGVQASSGGGGAGDVIWNLASVAPTYVGPTQFVLGGTNATTQFAIGNRVKMAQNSGNVFSTITAVSFSSPNTTVTVQNDSATLDASMSSAFWSSLTALGNTVDAGAVHYTSGLSYGTANTVGNALRALETEDAALQTEITALQAVYLTAGTSTAFTLTSVPTPTSYAINQIFNVKFHINGGANPTINVNSLGAKSIKQYTAVGALAVPSIVAGMVSQLMYDGTYMILVDQLPPAAAGAAPHDSVAFTSNDTWTCPAGVTAVRCTAVGGGGGGGGGSSSGGESPTIYTGGTGGAGGAAIKVVPVVAGSNYTISVGAAGAGSTSTGGTGGTSTFGSNLCKASGGTGGSFAGANGSPGSLLVATYGTYGVAYAVPGSAIGNGGIGATGFGSGASGTAGGIFLEW